VAQATSEARACNISRRGSNRRRNIGIVLAVAAVGAAVAVVIAHAPLVSRIGAGVLALIAGEYLFQVREKT